MSRAACLPETFPEPSTACQFPRRVFGTTGAVCPHVRKCFRCDGRVVARRVHCWMAQAQQKETAMENFIGFAEVAGAMIAALGLALGLEWVGLYGLTSMMPARPVERRQNQHR
jgi:hypothetical protein